VQADYGLISHSMTNHFGEIGMLEGKNPKGNMLNGDGGGEFITIRNSLDRGK